MKVETLELSARWKGALPARALALKAIAAALAESGVVLRRGAEVSLHLIDDEEMRALNAEWRGKDMATNVLSFPAAEAAQVGEARLIGDVLIAYESLAREAEAEGKPLADHFRHLVIHGFLHLLGFDHVDEAGAEAMEAIEIRSLARLGVADPYADWETADA